MQESSEQQLEKLTPILKIVKQREQLYLQLMSFVAKNIESSSSQHEQLSLFGKFLHTTKLSEADIAPEEKKLLSHFDTENEHMALSDQSAPIVRHVIKNNKQSVFHHRQILRLCSRLIEILQASISKTRKSVFNENGGLTLEFTRFKRNLHTIVKGETIHLGEFCTHILSYVRVKYKKQVARVEKYIFKLESGATIALRDLYINENSEPSSADEKETYRSRKQSNKKIEHNSSTESPTKRTSLKKTLKSSKKGHKLLKSTKRQARDSSVNSDVKPPKQYTASKLFKFYGMLELSKKQFLEDFIYEKNHEEEHRKKLMSTLLEKNKAVNTQISGYYKKSLTYLNKIKEIEVNNYLKSSGEEKQRSKSKKSTDRNNYDSDDYQPIMAKNSSLRKSFVISKRKSSLNFEKSSKILTENDEGKIDMSKTMKNLPVRRKSSAQTPQRPQNKSKKLFVIKSPVMFEDDNIPQAPQLATGAGWFRAPLSNRKAEKKSDNLRLKRRNNPLPMEKSLFSESFKMSENKF